MTYNGDESWFAKNGWFFLGGTPQTPVEDDPQLPRTPKCDEDVAVMQGEGGEK